MPNVGKRLTLYTFLAKSSDVSVPSNVVARATGAGDYSNIELLSYPESVARLSDYRRQATAPGFAVWMYGIVVLALLPSLIWRLVAGRDPDPPKNAPTRVELGSAN